MEISERRRRVEKIAHCLDDPDYEVIMTHADIIGEALSEGFKAQQFFTRLAPILKAHGIHTPPSLHTWRAVRKELLRRAAERVPEDWD